MALKIIRKSRKVLSMTLVLSLLFTLLPLQQSNIAEGADQPEDKKVVVGRAGIGNSTIQAENMSINFPYSEGAPPIDGFTITQKSGDFSIVDLADGDIRLHSGDSISLKVDVGTNSQLRQLALSGHARVEIGWGNLEWNETSGGCGLFGAFNCFQGTEAWMTIKNGSTTVSELYCNRYDAGDPCGNFSDSAVLATNTTIEITVQGHRNNISSPVGIRGMYIRFKDTVRPVLESYSFDGNGNEWENPNTGEQELYVKENEWINLTYKFSEPVRPSELVPAIGSIVPPATDAFLRHPLFANPDGTGLPAQGQTQYMVNQQYNTTNFDAYYTDLSYRYTGVRYHNSGNNPLEPALIGETNSNPRPSLGEKFEDAVLVDAAGNAAVLPISTIKAHSSSKSFLLRDKHGNAKQVNDPFDYRNGGFRVIVDAVRPKYSKSGNGIQPEILTGVTVNKNDRIEFTVQFSEEAMSAVGLDISKTFLYFNNGMRAYYVGGENSMAWTFGMDIPKTGNLLEETPLLKVIGLTNDLYLPPNSGTQLADKNVISDYAGNLLIQPANFFGEHVDGDVSLVNSKIDWARLGIDNTPPVIGFRFEDGGANDTVYRKNGKITIDANDPVLKIPYLEVDVDNNGNPSPSSIRGEERPSQGVYRPSNMTGDASPSVGLVYYHWSQSPNDPFAGLENDHFAAIKRFSLSAKQPYEELYPSGFENVVLHVANNKTNMIAPPSEALLPENSGPWYLHSWTADMSWDSARELKQYEKMKRFIEDNPEQYEAWKAEPANGSETDRIVYANNKALAAVGQYGDWSMWGQNGEFMEEDSNWTYNVTPFLLDNKAPDIVFDDMMGNNTMDVSVTTSVYDDHSGVHQVRYQWVLEGNAPAEIDWKPATPENGAFTASTINEIFEDGEYRLYVQATDKAGNVNEQFTSSIALVNSESAVVGSFQPDSNNQYVQSHDIDFTIVGIVPDMVGYVFSQTPVRPLSESSYAELQPLSMPGSSSTELQLLSVSDSSDMEFEEQPATEDSGSGSEEQPVTEGPDVESEEQEQGSYDAGLQALSTIPATYRIPADTTRNGIYYVHVMAKEGDRYYYYSKSYYFDNQEPDVTFSINGVSYPLESHEVKVTVEEYLSSANLTKEYQWVPAGEAAPAADSAGWISLPESGRVIIDNSELTSGETVDYRLYVKAVDGAGNMTLTATTGIFKVTKVGGDLAPAASHNNLIYLYGDQTDGYTAVLKLDLDTLDKRGYEYTLSPDNGESWGRWRPYTNFASVGVSGGNASQLQILVRYRTPGGVMSEPQPVDIASLSPSEPVYALASLGTTRLVTPETGVDITVTLPLGVKVAYAAVNPPEASMQRKGNTFTVHANGYYAFDLTDLNNRTETLYIVVNNIDGTPPEGTIEYLITERTNGNVPVQLASTSKPVVITNNSGKSTYLFTDNGSFTFEFRDEAGNVGSATATVTNIDKEAPEVSIVRSYTYGNDNSQTFGTITDGAGNILLSAGVRLDVVGPVGSSKLLRVIQGEQGVLVRNNSVVSFTVADELGNTAVVETVVDNVMSSPIEPEDIQYTFVDEDGNPLPEDQLVVIDGVAYAKGRMMVTLLGRTEAPNAVFSGVRPIMDNGEYTNRISAEDGAFSYSRIYSADGTTLIGLSDLLGNVNKVPVTVKGIDNEAPELTLRMASVAVAQNKADFDFRSDLGGYTVIDNVSASADIQVSISGLDLSQIGRQRVTYTAVDQVGNTAEVYQDVTVVPDSGMLIFANGMLISGAGGETALFDTNRLTFNVSRYNHMEVDGQNMINEVGTFDLFYYPGLYREGQMKLIATRLTYQDLMNGQYEVVFPQAGWYTIVVRNQERERVFATFFVSRTN